MKHFLDLTLLSMWFVCLMGWVPCRAQEASSTQQTRAVLTSWIEAEQLLSREALDWEQERVLMQDLQAVLDQEMATLEETISASEGALGEADRQREALLEQQNELASVQQCILAFLKPTESELMALRERLPEPLREQLAPLFNRLPADEEETSLGIAERMQSVLAIMDSIRAFDKKLTVSAMLSEDATGQLHEVKTLYLGLAQAFYVGSEDAGIGRPGASGWEWKSQPDIENEIRRAIAMVKGETHAIDFVNLPLSVSEDE